MAVLFYFSFLWWKFETTKAEKLNLNLLCGQSFINSWLNYLKFLSFYLHIVWILQNLCCLALIYMIGHLYSQVNVNVCVYKYIFTYVYVYSYRHADIYTSLDTCTHIATGRDAHTYWQKDTDTHRYTSAERRARTHTHHQ